MQERSLVTEYPDLLDEESVLDEAPEWLEYQAVGGFRYWQIISLVLGSALSLIVIFCCCVRFRIPRTKQDIEADYQRRKIARKFREKLSKINNSEMDIMDGDLQKALDRVRAELTEDTGTQLNDKESEHLLHQPPQNGNRGGNARNGKRV